VERQPDTILVITCECGYIIRGEIEPEFLANARNHIDEAHPEADPTDEWLLEMAEEQPAPY
jgi:predicted small metal-binding protein